MNHAYAPCLTARLAGRFALCLAALVAACEPPPVELEPTPPPTTVSSGDYRLTSLAVLPPDEGLDLDGADAADNHFPWLLDGIYAAMEEAVVPLLEEQLGEEQAAQAWTLVSTALAASGFPLNTAAYNATLDAAVRETTLNYLPSISDSAGQLYVELYTGVPTPSGYQRNAGVVGSLQGEGAPNARIDAGQMLLLYPGGLFNLEMLEARARFTWTGQQIDGEVLAGKIPMTSVVSAAVNAIPDEIEVNGQTIDLPDELIARELTSLLEAADAPDGTPLFDVSLEATDEEAISAGLTFEGLAVKIAG